MSGMQTTNSPNGKLTSLGPTHTFIDVTTGTPIPAVAKNPLVGTVPTQYCCLLGGGLESTKACKVPLAIPIPAIPTGLGALSGQPPGTHVAAPKMGYGFIKINGQPIVTNSVVNFNRNTTVNQLIPSQTKKIINGTMS